VLRSASSTNLLGPSHRAWPLIALTGALAALAGVALGRVRARFAGEETVEAEAGVDTSPPALVTEEPTG
jgi:hypothetical protein